MTLLLEAGSFSGTAQTRRNVAGRDRLNCGLSIIEFAKSKGVQLDKSQIQPVGVGIREPFVAKPANMEQAKQNMRVEFRVVRVPAEASKQADFDF